VIVRAANVSVLVWSRFSENFIYCWVGNQLFVSTCGILVYLGACVKRSKKLSLFFLWNYAPSVLTVLIGHHVVIVMIPKDFF